MTASVGGFVPKVQTPFQWFGQNTVEELTRKVHLLRDAARPVRGLHLRWHDPKATAVEGIVSRGDRRMGAGHRGGLAAAAAPSRSGPSTSTSSCGPMPWPPTGCRSRIRVPAPDRGRGAALGPPLGRPAPGLPVAGLAGRPGRARPGGLPVDPLLRLRGLHRVRHRARGGLGRARRPAAARAPARISQPGARCRYDFSPRRRPVPVRPPGRMRTPRCGSERGEAEMRVRFRFAKLGKVRFTSQRDVARMWERALRRAGLPLAYTEGFSPRPQLSFGLALPTGCESLAEYLDVALDDDRPRPAASTGRLPAQLSRAAARGHRRGGGGRWSSAATLPPAAGDLVLVGRCASPA